MDTTDRWKNFFEEAGITSENATDYAEKFFVNQAEMTEMLCELNEEDLEKMGISALFDRKRILKYIKKLYAKERDGAAVETSALSTDFRGKKIPNEEERTTAGSFPDVPIITNRKFSLSRRMGNSFLDVSHKNYHVDKTMIIQTIFDLFYHEEVPISQVRRPLLITAPRRFGKTTILDLLECFFGGGLSREAFSKFKIGRDGAVFKWYDKFSVIYVNFACSKDIVRSRDECIDACRLILHTCFVSYKYVLEHLPVECRQAFTNWTHEEVYKDKDENDILYGLRFLVECIRSYADRPVFLLVDEFDGICANAIYKTSSENLIEIIHFYSKMLALVVKHDPVCSAAVFSGITPITCQSHSDLNNPISVEFLSHDTFYKFYGLLEEEFDEVLTRETIPQEVKDQKQSALTWYNGYSYKNCNILNTFSVANFIELKNVQSYWKDSGTAEGLYEAVRQDAIRIELNNTVLDDKSLKIILRKLCPENFTLLRDRRFEVEDANFVYNFLLQQGYLAIIKTEENGILQVKIPNMEVKKAFQDVLSRYYLKTFEFDPVKIEQCSSLFRRMNLSSMKNCKSCMKSFKSILIELLSKEPHNFMNEAWFECFLFTIFVQSAVVQPQIKVEETAIGNDLRTAKVLDLFVQMDQKIFIIEETMICSGRKALEKMIDKEYYKKVKEGHPYMLIGIGVDNSPDGLSNITISYLVNDINEKKATDL